MKKLFKKLEDEISTNKSSIQLLDLNRRLIKVDSGKVDYKNDIPPCRYGMYVDPLHKNYVFVGESLQYHGHLTDDVLVSVAYDLLKIDNQRYEYFSLVGSLNNLSNTLFHLSKTCNPDKKPIKFNIKLKGLELAPELLEPFIIEGLINGLKSHLGQYTTIDAYSMSEYVYIANGFCRGC